MDWDGLEWHGMPWDGMGHFVTVWDGMGQNKGMVQHRMVQGRVGQHSIKWESNWWPGKSWDKLAQASMWQHQLVWDGMGWNETKQTQKVQAKTERIEEQLEGEGTQGSWI